MRSRELRCSAQQARLGRGMSRCKPYDHTSLRTPYAMHRSSRLTPISVLVHFHNLRIFHNLNFLKLHLKSQKWWIPRQMTNELLAQMSVKIFRKLNGARSTGTVSGKQYAYAMRPKML